VANIKPADMSLIINGNQKVINSRLSDGQFFWEQDKKRSLHSRLPSLDKVLFMQKLGSMAAKSKRISQLSTHVAQIIDADISTCARASLLCKADLVTDMVGEFADLQGIMGGYYAANDGESDAVALAIREHYYPRFAGDNLPSSTAGLVVSIADRIDNIVGIYSIGHKPTGSKDPYALKRAALGLLRIIIEAKLAINLTDLVNKTVKLYDFNQTVGTEITDFIVSRLSAYYQEQNIDKNVVRAVLASNKNLANSTVYTWHLRIYALSKFSKDDNFNKLVEINKRINNILKTSEIAVVESAKFATEFDHDLYQAITKTQAKLAQHQQQYLKIIQELLTLKPVLDRFFSKVMVNDEDPKIKQQRLYLLSQVRELFLHVADLTYLSK
jgi:glycyl-tRNA synthetase beta chain